MEMITTTGRAVAITIDDATRVGEARRVAAAMAGRLGFDETERGKASIVVTEAATNLHKHAQGGVVVIQGLMSGEIGGVEILSLDKGPGMADVERCLTDGYSTAGSPGTGMGAMARLSTVFDVHSLSGTGTAMMARLWAEPLRDRPATRGVEFGVVSLAVAGEEVCGDHWAIEEIGGRTLLLIVDGLGHGPPAADAARAAIRVFGETASLGLTEIVQAAHSALRSTRGAALAIAQLDPEGGEVRFVGVGNIAGSILGPAEGRSTSMVSHNGTVGHTIRKIHEFTYPWNPGALLVMHSDGLGTQWQLPRYAGLATKHPGVVAGTLYRDFKRERDDVTVVAVRESRTGPW
jgi:anti-sigma regulatory factor (Ser/Thr protein kinase)